MLNKWRKFVFEKIYTYLCNVINKQQTNLKLRYRHDGQII